METNLKKNSIDTGLILGTVLFILSTLMYINGLEYFYNGTKTLFYIPVILGFGIYSIIKSKKLQNQIISFKEAFTAYFLCIVIGYLIASTGDIMIFKFIDPEAGNIINEESMIITKQALELMDWNIEDINITLDRMQNNPVFSYGNIFVNYFIVLLMNAFIGMIPALILKKS